MHFGNAMIVRETIVAAGSAPGTHPTVPTPLLRPLETVVATTTTGTDAGGELLSAVSDAARAAADAAAPSDDDDEAGRGGRLFAGRRASALDRVLRGSDDRDALAAVAHSPALRAVAEQQRGRAAHAVGDGSALAQSPAGSVKGECCRSAAPRRT